MNMLPFIFHYLHIVAAAFWIGSLLYTELVLWPQLRRIGQLENIQGQLRAVSGRKIVGFFNIGTIVTGYFRALTAGVFDQLYSTYGQLFVIGSLAGLSMMVWWVSFPPRTMKLSWKAFYSAFWITLFFMVAMRFAAPAVQ